MVGGESGQVGVVHDAKEKRTDGTAVVTKSAPFRRRRHQLFPWESTDPQANKIPWEQRAYTFQWTNGGITVLPENWNIDTNEKGQVQSITKSPVPFANHLGFPEITLKQAKEMAELSAKTGCSLKVAFAKVYDMTQLSEKVQEKIALAPEMFANPSQEKVIAASKKATMDKFWKDAKADLKPLD